MTSAAYARPEEDPPLERVRMYAELFAIHFCALFVRPIQRFIPRAIHAKASAFLRGVEALVRRVLLIEAAAIVPTLPARRPPKPTNPPAAPRAPQPRKPRDPGQPPPFPLFRHKRARRAARVAPAAGNIRTSSKLGDLRTLVGRHEAIMLALNGHAAYARRLALRLRPLYAGGAAPQIIDSPRLHAEHEGFLARDLDILREDANEALRAVLAVLFPDTS